MSTSGGKRNNTNTNRTVSTVAAPNPVAVRQRLELLELEPHEGNSNKRIPSRFEYKSIRNLMSEQNTMCAKVAGRLLRVINADENSSKTNFTYNYKKRSDKTPMRGAYRLMLFQDLIGKGGCFYIKAINTNNQFLFSNFLDHRDNGNTTIGSIFLFLAPRAIKQIYCNDIPILEPVCSMILMKEPSAGDNPTIWEHAMVTEANKTSSFQIEAEIKLLHFSVCHSNCTGLFCDRQNLDETNNYKRGCGCYSTGDTRHAKLVLSFSFEITSDVCNSFVVEKFSSHKFTQTFLKIPFQSTESINDYELNTRKFDDLYRRVIGIVKYVNENGAWVVIGWSKRGNINDANYDEDQKVSSAEVKHHVTTVFPTYHTTPNFLAVLEQKKFDPLDENN